MTVLWIHEAFSSLTSTYAFRSFNSSNLPVHPARSMIHRIHQRHVKIGFILMYSIAYLIPVTIELWNLKSYPRPYQSNTTPFLKWHNEMHHLCTHLLIPSTQSSDRWQVSRLSEPIPYPPNSLYAFRFTIYLISAYQSIILRSIRSSFYYLTTAINGPFFLTFLGHLFHFSLCTGFIDFIYRFINHCSHLYQFKPTTSLLTLYSFFLLSHDFQYILYGIPFVVCLYSFLFPYPHALIFLIL